MEDLKDMIANLFNDIDWDYLAESEEDEEE
jgi:hypothetical protein